MELALIIKLILVVAVFAIALGIAAYSTYGERKIAAFFQDRLGPNRAGPFGLCNRSFSHHERYLSLPFS